MRQSMRHIASRVAAFAVGLLFVLVCVPQAAFAAANSNTSSTSQTTATELWEAANEASKLTTYSPYSYATDGAGPTTEQTLPEALDLRERGVVTPVKNQDPWGTCWSFSSIAASEISILSEMGKTYVETGLDLSERQLAYFAYYAAPDSEGNQAGEGIHIDESIAGENAEFQLGGFSVYATSVFASGTGPVSEEDAPYKNEEDVIVCSVYYDDPSAAAEFTLTEDEIKEWENLGATVESRPFSLTGLMQPPSGLSGRAVLQIQQGLASPKLSEF